MEKQVYLVAASHEQNRDVMAVEASELYTSDVYEASKAYVEELQKPWLILSEFHGLVWPTAKISPYDSSLFSDEERITRVERALEAEVIANTLISTLGIQPDGGKPLTEWKKEILQTTEFVLVGDSQSLSLAMTELSLAGVNVFCPFAGMKQSQIIERLANARKHYLPPGA